MKQFRKLCCLVGCMVCLLSGCAKHHKEIPMENAEAKVTFFNVGKGDAVLIETKAHRMLIDTGYDDTYPLIRDYLEEQHIEMLDYLVITHFDKDHVGGADRVLKDFAVEHILQPDYDSDASQYLEYCGIVDKKGLHPVCVTETMRFTLDEAEFLIYPPQRASYKEEDNDFSLVISMNCKEQSFLFAGDCEEVRLEELLEQEEFGLSHNILKVPHHGEKEDNSKEFLKAVAPDIAIITCSGEEAPSEKIREELEKLEAEIYLTSEGTVTCLCDGSGVQVIQ